MRTRRALLFMPGDSRRKIEKGSGLGVDTIIMDLEDGVALNNKVAARSSIAEALREVDFGRTERLVRINMVVPGWLFEDDIAVTLTGHPDGYVIPKVETGWQINHVSQMLALAEEENGWPQHSLKILAIIETAKGIVNLDEIASSDPRLEALIFGAEDFTGDIGAIRSEAGWEVFYARSAVVTFAKAYRLQAIDTLITDLRMTPDKMAACARESLNMGFDGKLAIHPKQVEPIQSVFSPDVSEILAAKRLIAAHDAHQAAGKGVFEYEGKMVDMPIVRAALSIIARAEAAGIDVNALEESDETL